jgi:hypothetical protein
MAHFAAEVGLVDGIMLSIRQQCDSSQSVFDEESHWTESDYAYNLWE